MMETPHRNPSKWIVIGAAVLSSIGLTAYRYQRPLTDACGSTVREYTNLHYGYRIEIPSGWRLGTELTAAVNRGIPVGNEEFVYVTRLGCKDETTIAATVPTDNPLSAGPIVQNEIELGNMFVVFANTTDAGLNFALSAS